MAATHDQIVACGVLPFCWKWSIFDKMERLTASEWSFRAKRGLSWLSSLYVFSHSLTRFVDLFRSLPLQRLMRAHLIVVEEILLQFVPELC